MLFDVCIVIYWFDEQFYWKLACYQHHIIWHCDLMSTSRRWQLMHIWKYLTVGVVTDSSYSSISVTVIVLQELQQFGLVFVIDKNRTSGMVFVFLRVNLALSELVFLNWFQSCHISTFSFQPNLPHCTDFSSSLSPGFSKEVSAHNFFCFLWFIANDNSVKG